MRLREEFLKYVEYQRAAEEMKRPEDFEKANKVKRQFLERLLKIERAVS